MCPPGAGYGAFALLAFALRQTILTEAVKERIHMEAAAQGWQESIADVRFGGRPRGGGR